jgi:hypothetical protein
MYIVVAFGVEIGDRHIFGRNMRTWSIRAHATSLKAGMFFAGTVRPMLSVEDSSWYDGLHPSEQESLGLKLKRLHDICSLDEFAAEVAGLFAARGDTLKNCDAYFRIYHATLAARGAPPR